MNDVNELKPEIELERINRAIKEKRVDTNQISDGYHTFGELYDHRIELYKLACRFINDNDTLYGAKSTVWKSQIHSDGSKWDGWFIMGIEKEKGKQVSYHLPISHWEDCSFAETLDQAPEFDGHTSADVLERLKSL